jgi:DNA invertase Pin-like site-specific DNA recombinase
MKVKYIRWSTLSQTGNRQLLDRDKYDKVMQEQISGSIAFAKRPKGSDLLKMIKAGKVTDLYVEEFSRLGRNAFDTLTTLHICDENDVTVHIQNMNLSSRVKGKANPVFKMFSHIVSVIAEQEREQIKERTEMGKIAARQKGVVFGRRKGSNERQVDFLAKDGSKRILKYLKTGDYSIREISKLTNASTTTVMKVKTTASHARLL